MNKGIEVTGEVVDCGFSLNLPIKTVRLTPPTNIEVGDEVLVRAMVRECEGVAYVEKSVLQDVVYILKKAEKKGSYDGCGYNLPFLGKTITVTIDGKNYEATLKEV